MAGAKIKQKHSFTLSPSSIAFVERLRKKRKAPSCSKVLDDLIAEAGQRQRRVELHAAMDEYYASVTDDDLAGDRAWGQFGLENSRS